MRIRLPAALVISAIALTLCSCDPAVPKNTSAKDPSETVTEEPTEETAKDDFPGWNKQGLYKLELGTLIGFEDCYAMAEMGPEDYTTWTIYNGNHEAIARQFAFGCEREPYYFLADVDGNGTDEIICNNRYNADGAVRIFIFRNNNGVPEVGIFDEEKMSAKRGEELYVLSYDTYYNPDEDKFFFVDIINDAEYPIDLSYFNFERFDPENTF